MDRTTKKSKAFLITFIAMLVLLIGGYLIFKNSNSMFGTKNSETITKNFSPLLGTSKDKGKVETKEGENTSSTNTGGDVDMGNGGVSETPIKTGVKPVLKPVKAPESNCKDSNGNPVSCETIVTASPTPEEVKDNTPIIKTEDTCTEGGNPVILTKAEKDELDALLAEYYRIAAKLKTEADISDLKSSGLAYGDLIIQAGSLTNDCKEQKANPLYTGPQVAKDNPFYQDGTNMEGKSYLANTSTYNYNVPTAGSVQAVSGIYNLFTPGISGVSSALNQQLQAQQNIQNMIRYNQPAINDLIEVAKKYIAPNELLGLPPTDGSRYVGLDKFFYDWSDFETYFNIW